MPVAPLQDHVAALRTAFQKDLLEAIPTNKKLSDIQKHWKDLDRIFGAAVTSLDFKMDVAADASQPGAFGAGLSLKEDADYCLACRELACKPLVSKEAATLNLHRTTLI